jgi:hypothetical protein
LVRRPVAVTVVVAVVSPPTSTIVVLARAVATVVVDTLGPSSSLDGVPYVAVGPETALDRLCCGSASLPALSMLGRRRIQVVCGRRFCPLTLRVLA